MKPIKFGNQMSKKERKQNIKDWIESYKNYSDLKADKDLDLAIKCLNKNELDKAVNHLTIVGKKYSEKIYDNFKKLIEKLTIPKDKEIEENIKKLFSLNDARETVWLLDEAIKEKKVELTEDELKIINEFGRECT